MPIVLSGSTSGSTTVQATDAVTATLTLPSSTGTLLSTANPQSGGVIQVVSATYSTNASTSSNGTLVTTGFSASITPKFSTSKIVVMIGIRQASSIPTGSNFAIYRNSTNITSANGYTTYAGSASGAFYTYLQFSIQDSPSTTSSTTYTLYFASNGVGTTQIQPNGSGDFPASITLMEIAA